MATSLLPFMLVYGEWIWKAVVAASVLGTAALALLVSRRRVIRAWRAKLVDNERPDEIRGVLRGAPGVSPSAPLISTLEAEHTDAKQRGRVSWRENQVWLIADDGREIELRGDARVLAGAKAWSAKGKVPDELSEAELKQALMQVPWLHGERVFRQVRRARLWRLRDGERVVARGHVRRVPAAQEASLREAQEGWLLTGGERGVVLHAEAPPLVRRETALSIALLAGFVGWLCYRGSDALGEHWETQCEAQLASFGQDDSAPPQMAPELHNTHACVLVAATPGRTGRKQSLELAERLRWAWPRDEHHFDTLLALTEFGGDCGLAFELARDAQDYPRLHQQAVRCRAPRMQVHALLMQGRFQEAADIVVPDGDYGPALPTVQLLVLAGRFTQAAELLRAGPDAEIEDRCITALLRHWGGDPKASDELRRLGTDVPRCAPHLAALEDGPWKTTAWIDRPPEGDSGLHHQPEFLLLSGHKYASLVYASLVPWLASVEPLPEAAPLRAHALRHRAVHEVLSHRLPEARSLAAEVRALAPASSASLEAVVQLYAGEVPAPIKLPTLPEEPFIQAVRDAMHGATSPLRLRAGIEHRQREHSPDALLEAQRGDGTALAHYLFHERHTNIGFEGVHASELLAVLPRLKSGRSELVRALVSWQGDLRHAVYRFSFQGKERIEDRGLDHSQDLSSLAVHAAQRRDVLLMAGAEREAAVWAQIFERFDAALLDRRKVFALLAL